MMAMEAPLRSNVATNEIDALNARVLPTPQKPIFQDSLRIRFAFAAKSQLSERAFMCDKAVNLGKILTLPRTPTHEFASP
jgi:hypothetical protein